VYIGGLYFGKNKIGYARVSTGLQNLNLQEDRLNQYGCEKI
jgi:DNA invertase Pin-like site-specific DNA recombinase